MANENRVVRISQKGFTEGLLPMLSEGARVTVEVTGDSMRPLWRHQRDRFVLAQCDRAALRPGDVVLYARSDGHFVLHRVVRVHESTIDACGDAQSQVEADIPLDRVMAVVTAFVRKGRHYSVSHPLYRLYSRIWHSVSVFRNSAFRTLWTMKHSLGGLHNEG